MTPRAPKRLAWPRDSQMTEVLTKAPASMVLNGYTRTVSWMIDSSPIRHSSPMTAPSSMRAARITSVFFPTTQPRRLVCGPM